MTLALKDRDERVGVSWEEHRTPKSSLTEAAPEDGVGSLKKGQRKHPYKSTISHPVGPRAKMVLKQDKDVLSSDGEPLGRGLQRHISGILLLSLF